MDKRIGKIADRLYLPILLFLYCLVRLPLIALPAVEGHEEVFHGTIAMEFLRGLSLSLWDYVLHPYGLGILFAGLWGVPFFALLGPSMFSLKFAAFVWHFLSLIAWYFVWKKAFSPAHAFWILLLFVFAPPKILEYSLINNGYHFEMILWVALSVLILRSFIEGRYTPRRGGLLLGFLGGFTSSLIFTNLLTQFIIWIYLFFWKGNLKKRLFYIFYCLGFSIGFCPWIYYNWISDFAGGSSILQKFVPFEPLSHQMLQNFLHTAFVPTGGFQGLFGFHEFIPGGGVLGVLYTVLFLISLSFLWWRKRYFWKGINNNKFDIEIFALLFQIFLILLTFLHPIGMRENYYLFVGVPFMGMTLLTVSRKSSMKVAVAVFCIGAGIIGMIHLLPLTQWEKALKMQGYSYTRLFSHLAWKYGYGDFDLFQVKTKQILKNRPVVFKKLFYKNFEQDLFQMDHEKDLGKYVAYIQSVESEFQPFLYEKLGFLLGGFLKFDPKKLVEVLNHFQIQNELYPAIYHGFVYGLNQQTDWVASSMVQKGLEICNQAPSIAKASCYEGLGMINNREWSSFDFHFESVAPQVESRYRRDYFIGFGRYCAEDWKIEPAKFNELILSLTGEERAWFQEGIAKEISFVEDPWRKSEWLKKLKEVPSL